jgi:hypothetical protein
MPPSILQNTVQQIAQKLASSIDIPDKIIQETSEQLRILNIKVRTGVLLPKTDRQETRAAVVLEYTCRRNMRQRIPMEQLAKAVGIKPAKLSELHKLIGNWLQPSNAPAVSNNQHVARTRVAVTANTIKQQTATTNTTRPRRSSSSLLAPQPSSQPDIPTTRRHQDCILPELSIRLAFKIVNPRVCAQAAEQLLDDIYRHIHQQTNTAAQTHLYDLHRYAAAYEAAAFYYFAYQQVQQQQQTIGTTSKPSTKTKSNNIMDGSILDWNDLESASTELLAADIQRTVPKIEQWVKKLDAAREQQSSTKKRKDNTSAKVTTTNKRRRSDATSKEDQEKDDNGGENANDDANNLDKEDEGDLPQESLQELQRTSSEQWRQQVLASALEDARKSLLHQSTPDSMDDNTLSDEACMEYAANQVFAKYNLISVSDGTTGSPSE